MSEGQLLPYLYKYKLLDGYYTNPIDRVVEWEKNIQRVYALVPLVLEKAYHKASGDLSMARTPRFQSRRVTIELEVYDELGEVSLDDIYACLTSLKLTKTSDKGEKHG
jgi:hypothetical protein